MKIISTLALSLILVSFASAQSPRMVLIEEFTNASCGPCANQNPAFNVLLNANTENVVSIKYQTAFPGYDPMNQHNPGQISTRLGYYPGITGVPTAIIDGKLPVLGQYPGHTGNAYDGAPAAYSQTMLNHATGFTSPFEIELNYTYTPEAITVTATATCTEAVSGNLKFHIAVIEKEIKFSSPPGSTNEKDFSHVMKKMLPSAGGSSMSNAYEVGEEFTTTQSWTFANIYDFNEIAVVAFIQDNTSKAVHQAAYNGSSEMEPAFSYDVAALSVSGLPEYTCEAVVTPSIEIRNNGGEPLTALTIDYVLNDVNETIEWTGNLDFFETETVSLGEITFTEEATNLLSVTLSNPNASVDENSANDNITADVIIAAYSTLDIKLEVRTDNYPGDNSWEIRNSNNQVVASASYVAGPGQAGAGGPDALKTKIHEISLDPFDCYEFKLKDSYGDGMSYGPASAFFGYKIFDADGNVIIQKLQKNFNFGYETVSGLRTTDFVKVDDHTPLTSIEMYPNPTRSNVNIAFQLTEADHVTVKIVNILGQVVKTIDLGTLSSGHSTKNIDVSNLSSGLYLININTKDSQVVRKLTITE